MYCSVLQCVAMCCSVLQCVAVRCSALQCVAVRCNMLQRIPHIARQRHDVSSERAQERERETNRHDVVVRSKIFFFFFVSAFSDDNLFFSLQPSPPTTLPFGRSISRSLSLPPFFPLSPRSRPPTHALSLSLSPSLLLSFFLSLCLYVCLTLCNVASLISDARYKLQHTATHCNTLQHTATHCNTLQHTATHCTTLQHTATHCNATLTGGKVAKQKKFSSA